MVYIALTDDSVLEAFGGELSIAAREGDQFGPAGIKLRCIAFIGIDVCQLMAIDCPKGRCYGCQGQRIAGGAAESGKNHNLALKEVTESGFQSLCPIVVSIGGRRSNVGILDGAHDIGANGCHIV